MLGDGTGFDILEIVPNLNSKIIFVTASDEYAIKAFKFAAIDYILKPYAIEELSTAIEKAKIQIQPKKDQLKVLKQLVTEPNIISKNKISGCCFCNNLEASTTLAALPMISMDG